MPEKVLKFYVQKVQKTTLNNGVAKMQKKSLKTSSIKIIFLIIKITGGTLFFKWMVNIERFTRCFTEVIFFNEPRRMNLFY